MAYDEKMPVTIHQVDLTRFASTTKTEVIDKIISVANAEDASFEEEPNIQEVEGYLIRIFSSMKRYVPRWRGFISSQVREASRLNKCVNQTYSFICFIGYDEHLFTITGGIGSLVVDRFFSANFGLEILVRLFERDSQVIKSIQDRGLTGIVLGQTKFYRGDQRFSDENQFGKIFKQVRAELNKKILTDVFGFDEEDLRRKTSACLAKSSFLIGKSVDFITLLQLVRRFANILKEKEKFTLNKVELLSKRNPANAKLIGHLDECFVKKIYASWIAKQLIDVDVCNVDFEKYISASNYKIPLESIDPISFDSTPSFKEIVHALNNVGCVLEDDAIQFKHSVLFRTIKTYDENNVLLTTGIIYEHLHGELQLEDNHYFLLDKDWYRIHADFITDLNKECVSILRTASDDNLISQKFDITKRESIFNQSFLNKDGWLVFDTIVPENIEACDILYYDANAIHLVHVKKNFDNSIRDLASQMIIAAKRIQEDIKSGFVYIDKLEALARKGAKSKSKQKQELGKQVIPMGGLKKIFKSKNDKNLIFCLAFVDASQKNRRLKDHIEQFESNIAKFALIEAYRGIRALGFDFKVIQLNKA